jgi:hypothetical protein
MTVFNGKISYPDGEELTSAPVPIRGKTTAYLRALGRVSQREDGTVKAGWPLI